jgi:hypothetical protein
MYVLGYLKAMLEDPNKRMTFQTIMYDIRLVQLLLDFIKYLYNLTLKQSAKEHLMPLEIHIAKIFKEMHIIFTLSCSNNSYNKQMSVCGRRVGYSQRNSHEQSVCLREHHSTIRNHLIGQGIRSDVATNS